jgi:hypothetical protein
MGMTITEKILARSAGKNQVEETKNQHAQRRVRLS